MKKVLIAFSMALLAMLSFIDVVNAQTTTYLYENFESTNGNALPNGWIAEDYLPGTGPSSTTYQWKSYTGGYDVQTGTTSTTNRCAYLYAMSYYVSSMALKTPEVTLSATDNAVLSFEVKGLEQYSTVYPTNMDVCVSTDGGATYPYVLQQGLQIGADWTLYELSLSQFKGQSIKVVFVGKSTSGSSNYHYLDEVSIKDAPTCQQPVGMYVSNLSTNSVTVTWMLKGAGYGDTTTHFQYEVLDEQNNVVQSSNNYLTTDFELTINNLQANNNYKIRLRSDCQLSFNKFSDWTEIDFRTLKTAQMLPYVEDFNSLTGLPDGSYNANAALNNITAYSYGGIGNSLRFNVSNNSVAYIVFPMVAAAVDSIEMSFMLRTSGSQDKVIFNAGYLTNPLDQSTYIPVLLDTVTGGVWKEVRFNTAGTNDQINPVMMGVFFQSEMSTTIFMDDVNIHEIPTCIRPEHVRVTEVSATNVTLDWDMTNSSNVRIEALNVGDSSITSILATEHPYTFEGLQPQTTYEFTLSAVCQAGDESDTTLPVTARTLCSVLANPIFLETFDELTQANTAPECWNMGWLNKSTSTKAAPFNKSTSQKRGTQSFSMYGQPKNTVSYLSSQGLNIDESGKYDLSLWLYNRNGAAYPNERMQVWISSNANDTVGGVKLGEISHFSSNSNGWVQYEYNIPVSGTCYVMLVGISDGGVDFYIDDIEVKLSPSCRKVSNIQLDTITTTTARLTWTAGKNEQQWIVDYQVSHGTTSVANTSVTVQSPQLVITNLDPAKQYTITGTVKAYCGNNDTAEAVNFSNTATTACSPITELPYTCGFESYENQNVPSSTLPICWVRTSDSQSQGATFPYSYSSSSYPGHSGSFCLYHYQTTSTSYPENTVAVMREVDPNAFAMNTLRIKFWGTVKYRSTSDCDGKVVVGVMTDPSDFSTFVAVDTITISKSNSSYAEYVVSFASYTGQGTYPALDFIRSVQGSNYVTIDDVTLELLPSCLDLDGGIFVNDVTDNSVVVNITDEDATAWQIAYGESGTAISACTLVDVSDAMNYTIANLESTTHYDIYARRNCGNGNYGAWTSVSSIMTLAVPATMPYNCGFENADDNSRWVAVNGMGANQFAIGSASNAAMNGNSALYISNDNGTSYSYTNSQASVAWIYRSITFESKGYQIEYNWKAAGDNSSYDFGKVMLCPTTEELPQTMSSYSYTMVSSYLPDTLYDLNPLNTSMYKMLNKTSATNATGWNSYSRFVDMTGKAGTYNLVILWVNDGSRGDNPPLAIDNINIYALTCIPPSTVTIDTLGSDTSALAFDQEDVNMWEVYVDNDPIDFNNLKQNPLFRGIDTTGNIGLGNLTANTLYYYTVRSICEPGDTSSWKSVGTFRTNCADVQIPYNEGFEDQGTLLCWKQMETTGSMSMSSTYKKSGSLSLCINRNLGIMPAVNVSSLTPYMMTGWAYATTDNVSFGIGVMSDPDDQSTYLQLDEFTIPKKNTWTEFTIYFSHLNDEEFEDVINARNIVLSAGMSTVYFDDLSVTQTPECPKPTHVTISNVTAHSFDISFIENGTANQWIAYCNGEKHLLNSNPATISDLYASTTYTVGVASICGDGDTSNLTMFGGARTACDVITTPWVCGFESEEGYVASTSPNDGSLDPGCWNSINNTMTASTMPYAYVSSSPSYLHGGSAGLYVYTPRTATVDIVLILPEFSDRTDSLNVEVWYKNGGTTSNYDNLVIGYVTDISDASSFVPLYTAPLSSAWVLAKVNMTNYANVPSNARIAFKAANGTYGYALYLDDITVKAIRSCSDPETPIISSISSSSAVVSVADTCASHTDYEYVYGPKGFDAYSATPVSLSDTNAFEILGLASDSYYDVYVRAVCGVGDVSNWIKSSFHTLCEPVIVTSENPFVDSFENATDANATFYTDPCYMIVPKYATSYGVFVYENSATYDYSNEGNKCLYSYIYNMYMPDGAYLFRPLYLQKDTVYQAEVYARAQSYTSRIRLMVGSEMNFAAMVTISDDQIANCSYQTMQGTTGNHYSYKDCYQDLTGYFTVPETGVYYVGVKIDCAGTSTTSIVYFDDFSVSVAPWCHKPIQAATIVSTTMTTMTVNVDMDGKPAVEVGCAIDGMNGINATPASITNTVVTTTGDCTLTELNANCKYAVFYRYLCSENDTSDWSVKSTDFTKSTNCFEPQNVRTIGETDTRMVTIAWGGAPDASGYHYELMKNGVVVDSGVVTNDTISFVQLEATEYSFRVQTYCATDSSAWSITSFSVSERIDCQVNSEYPYNEGFESMTEYDHNALINNCWIINATSTVAYVMPSEDANHIHSGTKGLYVYNGYSDGDQQTLIMPEMETVDDLMLSFYHKAYGENAEYSTLTVGYYDTDAKSFSALETLSNKSTDWQIYESRLSNIPENSRIAFRFNGKYDYYLDDIRINKVVDGILFYDTVCHGVDYYGHGIFVPATGLNDGENSIMQHVKSLAVGEKDSINVINIYVLEAIVPVVTYDTVCEGSVYQEGMWNIQNPVSRNYTSVFETAAGCDSSVTLCLYVWPAAESLRDTICQGDVYQFGDTLLTTSGSYSRQETNKFNCTTTITLDLMVVDSLAEAVYDTTCAGMPYSFEGQIFTAPGVYRVMTTGIKGCPVIKILYLTVTPTDSTCNVSFCEGGSVLVIDTVIDQAGQYELVRFNGMCDITYHINATEEPAPVGSASDSACEGKPFSGFDLFDVIITEDTTFTRQIRTDDGLCDSVVVISVKLNPTLWNDTEIVTVPSDSSYTWHNNTYTRTGIYSDTLQSLVTGCDSICTLNLTVGGSALEDIDLLNISLVPNPVNAGQTAFVYGDFSDVTIVEILNSFGQVVDSFVPDTYPIEIQGVNASGVYYIRIITEDDKVVISKLIVK